MTISRQFCWKKTCLVAFSMVLSIGSFFLFDYGVSKFVLRDENISFRVPNPVYHHGFEAMTTWDDSFKNTRYRIATNSAGLRDSTPRILSERTNRYRVVIVGDSFVEGQGVNFENSLPYFLENALGRDEYEVLNAGIVSYSPKIYFLKIKNLIEAEDINFDHLIVFVDISDIQNEIVYQFFDSGQITEREIEIWKRRRDLRRSFVLSTKIASFVSRRDPNPFLDPLFSASTFQMTDTDRKIVQLSFDYDFLSGWTSREDLFRLYGARGLAMAQENVGRLIDLCRGAGVAVDLVVYPWPQQVLARDRECVQVEAWRAFSERQGVRLIDLFPVFMDIGEAAAVQQRYFLASDVHWSVAGHRLVAEQVAAALGRPGRRSAGAAGGGGQ